MTFCVNTNGFPLPIALGQEISVDFRHVSDSEGEFHTRLGLYDVDGSLVFFAEDENTDAAVGFTVEPGTQLCQEPEEPKCFLSRWSGIFTAGGDSVELAGGETGVAGGFEFHLGSDRFYSDGGACDANTGWIPSYFVVRAPAE